eukprot:scaffold21796_cov124-Isochrysis_galbana.AAC.2
MVCPFKSDKCPHDGRRRLNHFSLYSQLYSHWTSAHQDNPAARRLVERFKIATKQKKDVPAALAAHSSYSWSST